MIDRIIDRTAYAVAYGAMWLVVQLFEARRDDCRSCPADQRVSAR